MHSLAKGMALLNGAPLGRFWSVGPEFTLYTPGPYLHAGANNIVIFDLQGTADDRVATTDHADYGSPINQ
jgi:beta-galactosidase